MPKRDQQHVLLVGGVDSGLCGFFWTGLSHEGYKVTVVVPNKISQDRFLISVVNGPIRESVVIADIANEDVLADLVDRFGNVDTVVYAADLAEDGKILDRFHTEFCSLFNPPILCVVEPIKIKSNLRQIVEGCQLSNRPVHLIEYCFGVAFPAQVTLALLNVLQSQKSVHCAVYA